jgi:hypothetical protein
MPWDQYTAVDDAELAALRQQLLNGLADDSALETMLGVGKQAVDRYVNEGMPYIKLGRRRLFDIPAVNVWLRSRPQHNAPPRGRGRPRRSAVGWTLWHTTTPRQRALAEGLVHFAMGLTPQIAPHRPFINTKKMFLLD